MANMIMASSSKTLITSSSSPLQSSSPKPPKLNSPQISILRTITNSITIKKNNLHNILLSIDSSSLKSTAAIAAAAAAAAVVATAPPAMAEQMEKAALFDFNLTLPVIMAEFLLLMVALDKIYYTPLGKFMDERDAEIKEKLSSVKDTSAEVKQLEEQAAAVMRAARAEIAAALNQMKKETTLEVEQKLAEGKAKVEKELAEALESLEKQKEDTIKALDSQIVALSKEIVKKVLPV